VQFWGPILKTIRNKKKSNILIVKNMTIIKKKNFSVSKLGTALKSWLIFSFLLNVQLSILEVKEKFSKIPIKLKHNLFLNLKMPFYFTSRNCLHTYFTCMWIHIYQNDRKQHLQENQENQLNQIINS